jgi:hypothetical protein
MNCLPTNDSVLASYTQWNTINSHYTHLLYICTQMVKEHNCNVPLLSLTGNSPVLDTITWGSFNFTWECSGSDNCITNAAGIACTCQQCNQSKESKRLQGVGQGEIWSPAVCMTIFSALCVDDPLTYWKTCLSPYVWDIITEVMLWGVI